MGRERVIGLAGLALVVGIGHASAECSVEPTHGLREHADLEGGRMRVQAGTACGITIMGIPGALSETKITQPPRFGVAGVRGNMVVYAAKKGFKGEDQFAYSHVGTDTYGGPMTITIRRKVDVVP
jgi:hypothetical protein